MTDKSSPAAAAALRMFRQGYAFLVDLVGRPRLDLNFVSFQRDLAVFNHVLHLPGWLGDVNFTARRKLDRGPAADSTRQRGGRRLLRRAPSGRSFSGAEIFARERRGG